MQNSHPSSEDLHRPLPPNTHGEEKRSTQVLGGNQSNQSHAYGVINDDEEAKLLYQMSDDHQGRNRGIVQQAIGEELIEMIDCDNLDDSKANTKSMRTVDGPEFNSRDKIGPTSGGRNAKLNQVAPATVNKEDCKEEPEGEAGPKEQPSLKQEALTMEQLNRKWENILESSYRLISWDNEGMQEADGITEFTSPTDVYPIRIELTPRQLLKMKIIRFIVFICCFYFIVPFDLYIHQHWRRIWLYETDVYQETVLFEDYNSSHLASDFNYTFNLTNCKVYLEERHTALNATAPSMQFDLEFGFPWGTDFEFNMNNLRIESGPNEMCIVKLFMSPANIIPKLIFNITGAQDNIMFQDNTNKYTSLQMKGGLEIQGEKAFITLSDHQISNFTVNLQYGIVILEDVVCPIRFINLTEGIYSDILPSQTTDFSIVANQPEGNICLRGAVTQSLMNGTCDVIDKGYNDSSYQDLGAYSCQIAARICASSTNCSDKKPAQINIQAYIRDGQIQASIRESTVTQQLAKIAKNFESSVNFTLNSFKKLNDSTTGYFAEPDISSISKFSIIGASYRKTWLYTNKKVYFQAQYWPLIWASAGLLTPKIITNKLLLIDNTCPTRSPKLTLDAQISSVIESMHPISVSADTAFTEGQTNFYRVSINSYGEAEYNQIKIGENPLLIAAFALSSVIALLLTLFSLFLIYKLYKVLKKHYNEYVMKRKNLSITLSLANTQNNEDDESDANVAQDFQVSHNQYEFRGVFKTKLENNPQEIKRLKLAFSFSLYQIPAMIIDYFLREQANSLMQFIISIKEDATVITKQKMKEHDKKKVSISLFSFQTIYSKFCNINGYQEIHNLDNEENTELLKSFGISFLENENEKEYAYSNMRLKSLKEQSETIIDDEKYAKMSMIQQFLLQKCVASQFKTDFLTFEQIKHEYEKFCRAENIPQQKQIQIIGSPEIIEFGAIVDETNPPKNILGITSVQSKRFGDQGGEDLANLVRVPCSVRRNIITYFIAIDGIIPNTILPIVHFCLILIVPLVSPFISFYALTLLTTLQGEVFQTPTSIFDFYYVNKLDPWWDNVPSVTLVLYIHIYVLAYLVFAYAEVFSYYLTGYQNNGKFAIMYTPARSVIMYGFYVGIFIYLFLYLLMAFFAVQWGILGAIFNPTVLLPYSAAILTFVATVGAKFAYYKAKVENLQNELENVIKEKLGTLLIKSLEKIKKNMGDKYASLMPQIDEKQTMEAIGNGFNQVMEMDGTEKIDLKGEAKKFAQNQLSNNASSIAQLLSNQVNGLDPAIIELVIAIAVNNDEGIKKATESLSGLLQVDGKLIYSFIVLAMQQIKGDLSEDENSQQRITCVVQAVKQLFRTIVQIDPVIQSVVGDVCKVLIEGDPSPLISLIKGEFPEEAGETINIDPNEEVIKELASLIVKSFARNSKEDIKLRALDFITEGYVKGENGSGYSAVDFMKIVEKLHNGDLSALTDLQCYNGIDETTGLLGMNSAFPILFLLDVFQVSTSLSNEVIVCSMKEIMMKYKLENNSEENKAQIAAEYNTSNQTYTFPEKMFLSLVSFARGNTLDLAEIVKEVNNLQLDSSALQIDDEMMQHFCKLSGSSSQQSLDKVIRKFGMQDGKDAIKDLINFLKKKKSLYVELVKGIRLKSAAIRTYFVYIVELIELLTEFDENRFLWEECEKKVKQYEEWQIYNSAVNQDAVKPPLSDNPKKNSQELIDELISLKKTQSEIEESAYKKYQTKIGDLLQHKIGVKIPVVFKGSIAKVYRHEEFMPSEKIIWEKMILDAFKANQEGSGDEQLKKEDRDLESGNKENENQPFIQGQNNSIRQKMILNNKFAFIEKDPELFLKVLLNFRVPQNAIHQTIVLNAIQCIHNRETKGKWNENDHREDIFKVGYLARYRVFFNGDMNNDCKMRFARGIAYWLGLDQAPFVLLMDLIKGDPAKIFGLTVEKSKLEYNLNSKDANFSILKQLNSQRLETIKKYVRGSEASLAQVFIRWHHQHKIIAVAKETIKQEYQGQFGLSEQFFRMIDTRVQMTANPKNEDESTIQLRQAINSFIRSSLRPQKENIMDQDKFLTPITDEFYSPQIEQMIKDEPKPAEEFGDMNYPNSELITELHDLVSDIPDRLISKILDINCTEKERHLVFRSYLKAGNSQDISNIFLLLNQSANLLFPYKYENGTLTRAASNKVNKQRIQFIGTQVILNASKISNLQKFGVNDMVSMKQQFFRFMEEYANIDVKDPEKLYSYTNGDEENLISIFYRNGFLDDASTWLLGPLFDTFKQKLSPPTGKEYHPALEALMKNLMGIILGKITNDQSLMRIAIKELFKSKSVDANFLHGFVALMQNDHTQKGQIEIVAKELGFDGALMINILMISDSKNKGIFNTILTLVKDICPSEQATIMAAYASLVRGDFTQVKAVLTKLEIPKSLHKHAEAVLALSQPDPTAIEEHMPSIKEILKTGEVDLIKNFVSLLKGRPGKIVDKLSITVPMDKQYIKSIYLIMYNGNKLRNLNESQKEEKEKILYQMQDEIKCFSTQCLANSELPEVTKANMSRAISLVIQTCWKSQRAAEELVESLKISKASLTSDKFEDPVGLLMEGIEEIDDTLSAEARNTISNKKLVLRILQDEVLPYLLQKMQKGKKPVKGGKGKKSVGKENFIKNMKQIFDEFIQDEERIKEKKLLLNKATKLELHEMAKIVGCTQYYTRSYGMHQPLFTCSNCKYSKDDDPMICLPCAILNHLQDKPKLNQIDLSRPVDQLRCKNLIYNQPKCSEKQKEIEDLYWSKDYKDWLYNYKSKVPIAEKLELKSGQFSDVALKREDFINQIIYCDSIQLDKYDLDEHLEKLIGSSKDIAKKPQNLIDSRLGRKYTLFESIILMSRGILTMPMKYFITMKGKLQLIGQ
ncbi:hypothetical protein FGO68_gene17400 [Halteria grandinella]|uniref:Uncharacterized protein n=1 Tax=Halteria grandinella TaxID=5974 RepID=A0A8J8PA41_HALGN|nr:hypothetical protein FGO68_gene17400 [Halteria grandinella]